MKLPVIALAALAFAAPAHAQLSAVQEKFAQFTSAAAEGGLRREDDVITGSLQQGGGEEFDLTLQAGKEYAIVALCDGDCSDLDLVLTTADGEAVDSDVAMDNYPVVQVQPARDGSYTLRVVMATCTVEPCFFGVGVFAKDP